MSRLDPRAHRGDVQRAVGVPGGDDPFEDHGDALARSRAAVSRSRWLTSGSVRKPQSSAWSWRYALLKVKRGLGLHQLIAQVEGVRRVGHAHPVEEDERVGVAQEVRVVHGVDRPILGEDPPVRVLDPPRQLGEVLGAEPGDLGVAEHDQPRLDVLGQRPAGRRRDGPAAGPGRSRGPTMRAQLITAVVRTLRIASSWQKPIRSVFTPAESTSVSSVRLPTPIIIGGVGIAPADLEVAARARRRSRSRSARGSGRSGTGRPARSRNSTVSSSPSSVPGRSGIATTSTPQSAAWSRLVALTLRTSSAPAATAAATSTGSKLSIETRMASIAQGARPRRRRPCQGPPGSQPRSIRSAPSPRSRSACASSASRESRGAWLISARISMS